MSTLKVPVYDAIVVGLGGAGSAALYHLAAKGLNVLGLEQFTLAHELGSSHGQTRIIRGAYHEGTLPPAPVSVSYEHLFIACAAYLIRTLEGRRK